MAPLARRRNNSPSLTPASAMSNARSACCRPCNSLSLSRDTSVSCFTRSFNFATRPPLSTPEAEARLISRTVLRTARACLRETRPVRPIGAPSVLPGHVSQNHVVPMLKLIFDGVRARVVAPLAAADALLHESASISPSSCGSRLGQRSILKSYKIISLFLI